MKPQELINARYTARISKTKDAGRIYMFLSILSDLEPGTYKHELTAEAVRDAVRNARTSPRRVLTEMIREAMTGQPKAVQILILLTLCFIVLAMVSLIVGLMAGASAQVFLSLASIAPVYQFTSHERLPSGSACPVHEMFQLYGKLQKGVKLTREEKDYIAERLCSNSGNPTFRFMGFAAPFAEVLPRIMVKQWGTWLEYYAPDKTALRKTLYGTIEEMVYL